MRLRVILSLGLLSVVPLAGGCSKEEPPSAVMMKAEPAAAPALAAGEPGSAGPGSAGPGSSTPALGQRAMRITVETTIVVGGFDQAMQRLRSAIEEHGGYVSEARVHGSGAPRSASLEARIPSAKVGAFRAVVASVGEVVADAEKAEDVTEQRADIGARLRNARAQEKRLLDLLSDKTGSLADVVAVERELAQVRETVERIEAQERLLEGQIAYATVKLSVTTRHDPEPVTAGDKIVRAASEGIENAWAFLVNLVVVLAAAGPTMLLLAAMGGVLYYVLRGVARRRRVAASLQPPFQAAPAQGYPTTAPPVQPYPGAAPPVQPYPGAAPPVQPYPGAAPPVQPYPGAAPPAHGDGGEPGPGEPPQR
ncbi:uncharacterized protein SOCE26_102170 [Sorangium cellulosum]|uniref:DUF4349 domain-containing protein n=1 Tax=Sorangium cellulosum TaxID=56 RepID=A0A2L0FAP1_SORCE|nr:DUF4349 domain-containing protein [Sorangium cellulosum]AUX48676.1 uncharacterized protein SOCE26_102170 [Sorangium cellulosum]